MAFFQKTILKKYQAMLPKEHLTEAWNNYRMYFLNPEIQENILHSKEEQFQEGFLRELFVKVLGYTLNPSPNYNLITEQKNEADAKKADGAIWLNGKVVGVIELKDHKTTDLKKVETQAFQYKSQNKDARYVIISNFEKLRLYIDNATEHREWNLFTMTEDDFLELYCCLAWSQIEKGIAIQMKESSVSIEKDVTKALYRDYSLFKNNLFEDILKNNPSQGTDIQEWQLLLYKKTQKLLDRLLFIFFAEDGGLLPPNSMVQILNQWQQLKDLDAYIPLYNRIKQYFGYLDKGNDSRGIFAYNGGLFREDEILDALTISDDLLFKHTSKLAEYDFKSDVDVNILGHIFEHSLSEIEEVTQRIMGVEVDASKSKRKKDGVFYTPPYITKYIVENTVGKLCEEKKQELGIEEKEYFSDRKRQKQTKQNLLEKLTIYRDWLLQMTILDPACGSGAFLNAALSFLMDEHHLIDEMEAKITGSSIVFPDIENSILEHNLYGVDINEESVEIAQLALWLRTAKPQRKLNSLNENIKCGNSLISDPAIAGDKAFDWEKEFPQVFAKGGFDVVIGNPPYVSAIELKKNYSDSEYKYLKDEYITAKGTVDLYIYFFEQGFKLLRTNGLLAYITPNRYLSASYGKALRELILNTYSFYQLIDYSDKKVFEDASTYPVISMICKGINYKDVLCGKFVDERLEAKEYPSNKLDILDDCILGFLLNDKLTITEKIIKQSESLTSVGEINATSTAKEADEYALLITEVACGYKLINTGTIDPYFNTWGSDSLTKKGNQYLTPYLPSYSVEISKNRHLLYSSPKIIISKIGLSCEAFYDKEGIYASIDTNCIHSFLIDYFPEYVLCWLNSKLYNYMFECLFDGLRMSGGYLLYSAPNLKNTYIKNISKNEQEPFIFLSNQMTSFHEQRQEKRNRFLRRLSDNFEGVKITGALSTFDQMEFSDFLKELKKQKITLKLIEQDDLEEYFNSYRSACLELTKQIAETDKEIDLRVYKLYGLTYDEVLIVDADFCVSREEYKSRD